MNTGAAPGEPRSQEQLAGNGATTQQGPLPSVSVPKGGGAIHGIGEKFAANPVTGTGSLSVPIYTSPGRSGFGPQLSLGYDSGAGNGPFGFGMSLSLPSISRKTDKGLPTYDDAGEADVFILAGTEDLVPVLVQVADEWQRDVLRRDVAGAHYRVQRYRPRVEGAFTLIERRSDLQSGETYWRSISRDNVTTIYGRTKESQIVDPSDPQGLRVFSWLICESYDDKGNAIRYEYKTEDSDGVDVSLGHERNRTEKTRSANRYLKRIKYANRTPRQPNEDLSLRNDWLLEVILDYGEHYTEDDQGQPTTVLANDTLRPWQGREDPFSTYRAGFEVRAYRLCQRVMMFHHFANELGQQDYLVRATHFTYGPSPLASVMTGVTQSGYVGRRDGTYLKKSLPSLQFEFSQAIVQEEVREIDPVSLENLPYGLDGTQYRWVDLDGEGLSGLLTEQGGAWFYKRNQSSLPVDTADGKLGVVARFAPVEHVATLPSLADLAGGQQQLIDLAGHGQLDLVQFASPPPGYFERTNDERWMPFAPFASLPNLQWSSANLKFVDVTGDGHADILISEDAAFTWYRSLGEGGFGEGGQIPQAVDEEKGPRLLFADSTQSIYLADMSGDGLTDLVRITNGEVCYWPNLGYGHFGAKVTMDNAPWFDSTDQFDQGRIRLADIDGSGNNDIIYLDRGHVRLYFNQSGNSWSQPRFITTFPRVDNRSSVYAVDLLGNGTACLVWSSPLLGDTRQPMRYIDLMGGQKPHLLTKVFNNLGAEIHVQYAPSTKFYLADKTAGKPWITKLPFPVQVVQRTDTYDRVSRNRFVTRYAYHHGYFDGIEREFRGFGLVEHWDTEEYSALSSDGKFPAATNIDAASHVPPILTKTWFHTGAFLGGERISRQFENDYYRESDSNRGADGLTDAQLAAMLLEDTVMPDMRRLADGTLAPYSLSAEEAREACRSLKGSMLRQEIYSLDGTDEQDRPYTVSESNYTIELFQERGPNRHAVFFVHARETVDFHYDRRLYGVSGRELADPRVSHAVTLAVDTYGNVLRSVAIGYGRRFDDPDPLLTQTDKDNQKRTILTYQESAYTNPVLEDDAYRTPRQCESRSYELLKVTPDSSAQDITNLFRFEELRNKVDSAADKLHDLPYEDVEGAGAVEDHAYRRLNSHTRTLYRRDDLAGPLALGELQTLALPFEAYRQAFTPGLAQQIYVGSGKMTLSDLNNVLVSPGGYASNAGEADWWIPSGQVFYSPGTNDTVADEQTFAGQHFVLPHRYRDPFHTNAVSTETFVTYDAYDLLVVETRDALGNRTTVGERDPAGTLTTQGNDYRVLQASLVMNPNRNRTAVAFDALAMVVGTAVMAKPPPAQIEGDSLDGFEADLTEAVLLDHIARPLADPQAILQRAATRLVYDLFAYQRTEGLPNPQPAVVYALVRETHDSDPVPEGGLKIQHSFSYSDGFGREIQKKTQAEVGSVPMRDASGNIVVGTDGQPLMTPNDVSPRWVGSGWTVFNNKGKAVRQYDPFFTDTHSFEFDVRIGVSPILFYDPIERVVGTLHPNRTWEKVVFNPWRQENWDVNDTVLVANPTADPDVGGFFRRLPDIDYLPTWYAQRQGGALGLQELAAAQKAAVHAETPTVTHADSLGRTFLTVAHNKFKYTDAPAADPPNEEFHCTRLVLDIEGNHREVIDAKDRIVMRYSYDMVGTHIQQASMEAGERWILNDVAGKPLFAWDSRNQQLRTEYDPLRRPTNTFLREGAGAELLVWRTVYGETLPNPEAQNQRGNVVQLFDQAGVVTSDEYDFKGNRQRSQRQLAQEYKTTVDWSAPVPLETVTYMSRTRYDALNRPIQLIAPHGDQPGTKINVIESIYNEANLLEQVHAWLNQDAEPADWLNPAIASVHAVANIDYDAKGRRMLIDYGNGVRSTYSYDPLTSRLVQQLTARNAVVFPDDCPQAAPADWPGCQVQNLQYTYDPVGNVTYVRDEAQQTIYFRNTRVEPSADYTYDALYRLIEATGREHLGQIGAAPSPSTYNDETRMAIPFSSSDGNAMARYLERYVYDAVGNFQEMIHRGSDPANSGWTRSYTYDEASLLEPAKQSNRLTSTTSGATTETYSAGANGYDSHGNMQGMPQLQIMQWDFRDQLQMTQRQAVNATDVDGAQRQGERTWYRYDTGGQRVRKLTELATGQTKDDHIYLAGFEIYHRQGLNELVRETLHVTDDKQRIALAELRTDSSGVVQLSRYQFDNHLGSVSLELDEQAQIISYEEYYPYGSTSYQAVRSQTEAPKQYRYTGKERDDETGLYYYGARYCAPWLGRWVSCDPLVGEASTPMVFNRYVFANANPIVFIDPDGRVINLAAAGIGALIGGVGGGIIGAWRAKPGERLGGFGKGAAIGAGVGALAGLTFGVSLAATGAVGIGGVAVAGGGTTGSVLVSATVAGAVGGGANAATTTLVEGGTGQQAWESGTIGAFTGSVGGAVGGASGVVTSELLSSGGTSQLASYTAGGVVGGATSSGASQAVSIAGGVQEEFSTADLLVSAGAGGAGGALAARLSPGVSSDEALVARANKLSQKVSTAYLQDKGAVVTKGALGALKREMTVGVMQAEIGGDRVTTVAVNNPKYYDLLQNAAGTGELVVEPITGVRLSAKTGQPLKTGGIDVHAEQVLAADAVNRGATEARVATSNKGCEALCVSQLKEAYPFVRHVNPKGQQ